MRALAFAIAAVVLLVLFSANPWLFVGLSMAVVGFGLWAGSLRRPGGDR